MNNPDEIVYCLGCHHAMMAQDAVCPGCGEDQNILRARNLQGRTPAAAQPPSPGPYAAPAPGSVYACPRCGMAFTPGSVFCSGCGHSLYAPAQRQDTFVYIMLGFLFAAISLIFCPLGFGAGGIAMGVMARKRDPENRAALVVIAASTVCMVIGMIIGAVTMMNVLNQT